MTIYFIGMGEDVQKVRLFVAVFPNGQVVEKLQKAIGDLRKKMGPQAIRWTLPEQLHLTMAFIGPVEQGRVAEFETVMETVAHKSAGCLLETEGVGCFPNAHRPRVLWAGLTGKLNPLMDLQKTLEQALQGHGYVPEERAFHPHLTLGRVNPLNARERQALGDFLDAFKTTQFGQWQADRMELMQSVLSPHGAKYAVLKSYPLKLEAKKF